MDSNTGNVVKSGRGSRPRPLRPVRLEGGRIVGPDLLTIAELAVLFGVRRETVWKWRRAYGFPSGIVVGVARRVPRSDVEEWIAQHKAAAAPPSGEAA